MTSEDVCIRYIWSGVLRRRFVRTYHGLLNPMVPPRWRWGTNVLSMSVFVSSCMVPVSQICFTVSRSSFKILGVLVGWRFVGWIRHWTFAYPQGGGIHFLYTGYLEFLIMDVFSGTYIRFLFLLWRYSDLHVLARFNIRPVLVPFHIQCNQHIPRLCVAVSNSISNKHLSVEAFDIKHSHSITTLLHNTTTIFKVTNSRAPPAVSPNPNPNSKSPSICGSL
jgi:hypothetical protein